VLAVPRALSYDFRGVWTVTVFSARCLLSENKTMKIKQIIIVKK